MLHAFKNRAKEYQILIKYLEEYTYHCSVRAGMRVYVCVSVVFTEAD